jgi:hypothetical protein
MRARQVTEAVVLVAVSAGISGLLGYGQGWKQGARDGALAILTMNEVARPDTLWLRPVVQRDVPAGPGWVQVEAYDGVLAERDRAEHVLACVRGWVPTGPIGADYREDIALKQACRVDDGRPKAP